MPPVATGREGLEYDGEPSIAVDLAHDSVYIAFTRWQCFDFTPNQSAGIFMVTDAGGSWSEAVQVAGPEANSPSFKVFDGDAAMAYAFGAADGGASAIWYAGGQPPDVWSATRVARRGTEPSLQFNPHGGPNILYTASGVWLAWVLAGAIAIGRVPGAANGSRPLLVVEQVKDPDTGDAPVYVAWESGNDQGGQTSVLLAGDILGSWTEPTMVLENARLTGFGVSEGVIHVVAASLAPDQPDWLLYAVENAGLINTRVIDQRGGETSVLALDADGHPHVAYVVDGPDGGVWYAAGPSIASAVGS
jgi:hypothetical protein